MSLKRARVYTPPIPKMPVGLIELMEGLAKDVLKNNPESIYEFCAQHMEKLLILRDGGANKKVLTLSQKIQRAQEKVRKKAELRRKQYDKKIHLKIDEEDKASHKKEIITNNTLAQTNVDESVKANGNADDPLLNEKLAEKKSDKEIKSESEVVQISENRDLEESTLEISTNQSDENKEPYVETEKNLDLHQLEPAIGEEEELEEVKNKCSLLSEKTLLENNVEPQQLIKDRSCEEMSLEQNNVTRVQNEMVENKTAGNDTMDININDVTKELESQIINYVETKPEPNNAVGVKNENTTNEKSDIETDENTESNSEMFLSSMSDLNNEENSKEKETDNEIQNKFSNTMDLETAAITIQKVFRSFLFRSKTASVDEATNVDINSLISNTNTEEHELLGEESVINERRILGLTRMDTVLQTVNEEKSLSLSTDDSSTLSSAATMIQAHVRGFLVRNKLNFNKTTSSVSNIDSDAQYGNSLERGLTNPKNKTILNIHIVPEGENFISRDESMMTSYDISLDGSPSHSTNLHPLGYDKNERRKQLKREDAIQSISPPSNNSGKSEDTDLVKEIGCEHSILVEPQTIVIDKNVKDSLDIALNTDITNRNINVVQSNHSALNKKERKLKINSKDVSIDEMDVVGPFNTTEVNKPQLMHSSEFHDVVLPTMVSRSNTSVVREFQNVLVYFLFWNNS